MNICVKQKIDKALHLFLGLKQVAALGVGFFHSFSFLMSFCRNVLFTFSNWPASFFIFLILFSFY